MTGCPDWIEALNALFDGELDGINARTAEAHIRSCPDCAREYERLGSLRDMLSEAPLRHRAPSDLRTRLEAVVPQTAETVAIAPHNPWSWLGGGTIGAIAASLTLLLVQPVPDSQLALADQVIAGHIRSLQAGHLVDVPTSDRHQVKPWFNGHADFAPPVIDLADRSFSLAGGRMDYLDGHSAAAIVYRHGQHRINLFIWPASAKDSAPRSVSRDGYTLENWQSGGLTFWAVSDIDPGALHKFTAALRAENARR